jgi:hypothetical protein
MPRTLVFTFAVTICIGLGFTPFKKVCDKKKESAGCYYWQSKVDAGLVSPADDKKVDETDPRIILDGIDCLLQMESNRNPAKFSGATNPYVSQIFQPATVEVAALYYISYLYYQKWDHADAIALRSENGEINSPKAIQRAYKSYRKWFEEVRKIGLAKAREMKLDPLKDAKVRWY